jgi:hypothetical protein
LRDFRVNQKKIEKRKRDKKESSFDEPNTNTTATAIPAATTTATATSFTTEPVARAECMLLVHQGTRAV